MEKAMAVQAIIWIFATIYFTYQAIKGNYPVWYGVATSTMTVGLGSLVAFLIIVVIS